MHMDLFECFKEHLHILNRSPVTVSAYIMHTQLFLKAMPDVKGITTAMIESWIQDLYDYRNEKGQPYSIATISIKIRAVKRFFEFLEKTNAIFIDPAEFIKEPKKKTNVIKPCLTQDEARKILDQPNLATLIGVRDRTVLELFYDTGIRLNELCSLTLHDSDLKTGVLRINKGKGYKDRLVPLGTHAARFIKQYIKKVRPKLIHKDKPCRSLFIDSYGNPLSKQAVMIMIRHCVNAAGIKKKVTAHTFRHTFATLLVKNGAQIPAVQKMLGHEDIRTTQVYIRSLNPDIKKEHQRTHPRERDMETFAKPRTQKKDKKVQP